MDERPDLLRRATAEGIAAFALVFAGCGAIVTDSVYGGLGVTGTALVFGLVIAAMIYATGHLSGAHINPAVTIAFTLARHFPPREALVIAVATDTRAVGSAAALAIGATVALDAAFGGPVTGASMNPARSIGPALATGELTDLWIYVVGPVLGAAIGAAGYQLVRGPRHARG